MAVDLVSVVLDHLRSLGPGRMILAPGLQAGLRARLEAIFSTPGLARADVMRLLKLIAVLDEEPGTREAGEELIELLRTIPAAVAQLSAIRGRPIEDRLRKNRLRQFEQRPEHRAAPHVEARDTGELKLSDLRRPVDPQRMRAWSSSRGQPKREG